MSFYRYICTLLIALTITACGSPQPAQAATNGQVVEFLLSQVRASGVALSGGKVYFYAPGTTTPKAVWTDRGKTIPAANPYTLDSNATAQVYGDGLYRIVIKDSAGVTKYDRDNISIRDISGSVYDVADYASLNAAVAAIGSTPATLQYAADATVTANLVIPATLELMPLNGAKINHGTYTISYAGTTARWPMAQIFNGTGAVTGLDFAAVVWFGAKKDGSTDSKNAFTSAANALVAGGTLYIPQGKWKMSTRWSPNKRINVIGDGIASVIWLDVGATETGVLFGDSTPSAYTDGVTWRDFAILGTANSCLNALVIDNVNNSRFQNVHVWAGTAAGGKGVWLRWGLQNHYNFILSANITYPYAGASPANGIFVSQPDGTATVFNANKFDCVVEGVAGKGVYAIASADNGNSEFSGTYQGNGGNSIHLVGLKAPVLTSIHSEATAASPNTNEIVLENCTIAQIGNGVNSFAAIAGGYNDVQIINSFGTVIDGLRCSRLSIDSTSSGTEIAAAWYSGASDAGLYDSGIKTNVQYQANNRLVAKSNFVNGIYGIAATDKVKGLWLMDAVGATQTLTDKSTIGGATAHTATIRNNSLVALAASSAGPGTVNMAPYLTFNSAVVWDAADSNDFTFGDGSTDSAFSVFGMVNPTLTATCALLAKDSILTGATKREWNITIAANGAITVNLLDDSAGSFIGRTTAAGAVTAGVLSSIAVTYSGNKSSAGVKIYVNGVQVDNANSESGVYTAMENKTALLGSYIVNTSGNLLYPFLGAQYVMMVNSEELTATQIRRLDYLSRSFAGSAL